jgi:Holliday junction resolvasome RuvABC ATP-dependent DNA helicase subunit
VGVSEKPTLPKQTKKKPRYMFIPTMSRDEARALATNAFSRIIGCEKIVEALILSLVAASQDGYFKPLALIGAPGYGKSYIINALKDAIRAVLGRRRISFETGRECGTRITFTEQTLIEGLQGGELSGVVIIDEVHEAVADVRNIVRTCIQPDSARLPYSFVPAKDYQFTFNPLKHSFVIGTNKVDKLDPALLSRFERKDLPGYSDDEMERILHRALADSGYTFNENTLRIIAECNRGSARDIQHWQDAVRSHLVDANKKTINREDVRAIIKRRETYPLGVTANELRTLLLLEKEGDMQLKRLAAMNGIASKEQNANELYLLQRGLIEIDGRRHILPAGLEYLRDLRRHKFVAA